MGLRAATGVGLGSDASGRGVGTALRFRPMFTKLIVRPSVYMRFCVGLLET